MPPFSPPWAGYGLVAETALGGPDPLHIRCSCVDVVRCAALTATLLRSWVGALAASESAMYAVIVAGDLRRGQQLRVRHAFDPRAAETAAANAAAVGEASAALPLFTLRRPITVQHHTYSQPIANSQQPAASPPSIAGLTAMRSEGFGVAGPSPRRRC